MTSNPLAVNVAGIEMESPVVLLSGCASFGEDFDRLEGFDWTEVGALCLKGTTLHPRPGNPPPRVTETPGGILNAIGLQNPGARKVVDEILPRIKDLPAKLIANIAGATVEEYGEVATIFDDSPVDGIEINISCPNVKCGGAAFGADPKVAAEVVELVRKSTAKPIITKLSPNVTDIAVMARAAIEAGSDALAVMNTLMGMAINTATRKPVLGNLQGGLSGPAIKPAALLKVWQTRPEAAPKGIPIIGQGGCASALDAVEFLLAGSTAVGIGAALFKDPHLSGVINAGLRAYLAEHGFSSITELTGALQVG